MQIKTVVCRIQNTAGDVGAVVSRSLEIRQQVGPHEARFNTAMTLLHAQNMARAHLLLQCNDDLFQRLYLCGGRKIFFAERALCRIQYLTHRADEHLQLFFCGGAEAKSLAAQFFRCRKQVHGVVGDTLKIADNF